MSKPKLFIRVNVIGSERVLVIAPITEFCPIARPIATSQRVFLFEPGIVTGIAVDAARLLLALSKQLPFELEFASTDVVASDYYETPCLLSYSAIKLLFGCYGGAAYHEGEEGRMYASGCSVPPAMRSFYRSESDENLYIFGGPQAIVRIFAFAELTGEDRPETADPDRAWGMCFMTAAPARLSKTGSCLKNRPYSADCSSFPADRAVNGAQAMTGSAIQRPEQEGVKADRYVARATIQLHRDNVWRDKLARLCGFIYNVATTTPPDDFIKRCYPLYVGDYGTDISYNTTEELFSRVSSAGVQAILSALEHGNAEVDLDPGASLVRCFLAGYIDGEPITRLDCTGGQMAQNDKTAYEIVKSCGRGGVTFSTLTVELVLRNFDDPDPTVAEGWHMLWGRESAKWSVDIKSVFGTTPDLSDYRVVPADPWRTAEPDRWAAAGSSKWRDSSDYGPRTSFDSSRALQIDKTAIAIPTCSLLIPLNRPHGASFPVDGLACGLHVATTYPPAFKDTEGVVVMPQILVLSTKDGHAPALALEVF